jgi:hypothetical protein
MFLCSPLWLTSASALLGPNAKIPTTANDATLYMLLSLLHAIRMVFSTVF